MHTMSISILLGLTPVPRISYVVCNCALQNE